MATNNDFESFTFPTGDTFLPVAKVKVKAPFPFDLAFAMTVHKAQGRTILRVVLDLAEHPSFCVCRMVYAAIFVALSHVRNSDHIRLLEPSTTASRTSLYEYLLELLPTPTIAPVLHGFPSSFATWNAERALAYVKPTTPLTLTY